ncbi:MAG TPA: NAD(P)-binding domain-containing protein [Candidatus Tumulicola sp.]
MNVGILGSGDVAKALAAGFLSRGDRAMLGTREPEKLAEWSQANSGARVGTFADAAAFGEIVVLATRGTATVEMLERIAADAFDGKVVIDATNPLRFDDAGPHLAFGFDDSLGERVQRALPTARVVKAFNIVGAPEMVAPTFDGGPPTMFVAGNDDAAKQTVADILRDFKWDVADLGGIESARYLEPMCLAWVVYGLRAGNWHHAFKLLR